MLEQRSAKHIESEISAGFLVGVPMDPVLAVPKIDVVGAGATKYEARTFSNGGAVVVSKQNPAEAAVNVTLRPKADIVELGPYSTGDYDLVSKMQEPHGHVTVNGRRRSVSKYGVIQSVGRMARQKGVRRMVTHEVDPRLKSFAEEMGLELRENPELCRTLGTKSGLNNAIANYRNSHPETMLVPFGENVSDLGTTMAAVARLQAAGKGAYLKLDTVRGGIVAAGGEGHLSISLDTPPDETKRRILTLTGGETYFMAVTQMQLEKYKVLSLSSGQDQLGKFVAYEAHEQTVDGNTADGALPITDPFLMAEFTRFWRDVKEFYEHFGITGDQNLNAMVLTPEDCAVACSLYGEQNVARMMFVDFNYRAISGTKNAMARLQEDTRMPMDLGKDYRSKGIKVGSRFAANPHLMFAIGRQFGLQAGVGGNFTVVNMGTFTPEAVAEKPFLKTQVIVQCDDASAKVDSYEVALLHGDAQALARSLNVPFVDPTQVPHIPAQSYHRTVRRGMEQVLNLSNRHETPSSQNVRGNIWAKY